jgi:hypothetical protein
VRTRAALVTLALLTAPASGFAQAAAPEQAAPAQAPQLPAGHPASGAAAPAAAPQAPEQDAVVPNPRLPPGSIQVKLVNETGSPLPNTEVKLGVQFQKISEGEQHSEKLAKTDAEGLALFSGLTPGSDFSYRVSSKNGPALYSSDPIQLKPEGGVLALLHVYPVTRNIEEASIGARGFVYVETRDDVFQFEVLFRYFNMGGVTWVPEEARMKLPEGFKAFKAGEAMDDSRFEEDPSRGVKLAGTLGPGQHNVSFRFQLPRHGESSASFRFGLPPHTAEIRFIAEAAPSMQLDIEDFEKPQTDVNQNGQRVVVTRHVAKRGEPAIKTFTAQLSGIPTPGYGRWIAVLIALFLAALGAGMLRGMFGEDAQADLQDRDAERAHRVLLDELVDLTRARKSQAIGPSTYESARRVLVEALSRIVSTNPGLGKKSKTRGAAKGAKKAPKDAIA